MRWGILGPGTIAVKFAKTIQAMNEEGQVLAAVASRSLEKAQAFANEFGIPACYASYEALVRDPEVDAVYIATPNSLHYEHAMLCLSAGKHVLCEKPFTTCAEDARKLFAEARKQNCFIMEGLWTRFLPLYQELKQITESGKYGKLMHVRCNYGFIARGERRTRKFRADLGGGALLDIGIYNLAFLYTLLSEQPESIHSCVQMSEYQTDAFSALQLGYAGGRTAYSAQAIGLVMEKQAALYYEQAEITLPDFQNAFSAEVKPVDEPAYTIECKPDINGFEYEVRAFEQCVRNGEEQSSLHTPEDTVSLAGVMDRIREQWNMKFPFETDGDRH